MSLASVALPGVGASVTVTTAPQDAEFATIFRALDAFNAPLVGHARSEPMAVLLRDDGGAVVGGLCARTAYGWLVIQMLFVPAELRGRGVGSVLVSAAEAYARDHGCVGMQVDTFSFQAQPFYERLGFTVFGVQDDFPPGYRCIYLRKPLRSAQQKVPLREMPLEDALLGETPRGDTLLADRPLAAE